MAEATRNERYLRYSGIVDPADLIRHRVAVIGVGAIGRQVALALAAMGVRHISLWDGDAVEEHNMGTQGYRPDQVGTEKVKATFEDMCRICPEYARDYDYTPSYITRAAMPGVDTIFCCVDTMSARKFIYTMADTIIDTRMSAFTALVFHANPSRKKLYSKTLYDDKDAFEGPCTARATFYTAGLAAGLAVNQWVQGLRSEQIPLWNARLCLDSMTLDEYPIPDEEAPAPQALEGPLPESPEPVA